MSQFLLVVAVALTVGAIVFGLTVLLSGDEPGLRPVEPDGQAVPLPADRPLSESDLAQVRFDTALRGYRMGQVDAALRRAGYDIGYKDELIRVLLAEVDALRQGRTAEAEALRESRLAALAAVADQPAEPAVADEPAEPTAADEPAEPAAADDRAVAESAVTDGTTDAEPEPADAEPASKVPDGSGQR